MKIKQLREYLNQLPEELDNFTIVYSTVKVLENSNLWSRLDQPIESVIIDENTDEMVIGTKTTIDEVIRLSESISIPSGDPVPEPTSVGLQTADDSEPIEDGTYPCLWSGYNVEIKHATKTYNMSTEPIGQGIKGMNIPSVVVIKNGQVASVTPEMTYSGTDKNTL